MNYKIKVESEAESKEAQELFFELDYMVVNNMDCEKGFIVASKEAASPINFDYWCSVDKETTLPELRDLVVLKRETLNDKVASAEAARQADKVLKEILEGGQDNVNQPSHYNKGGIECINAIQSSMTHEAFCGYLKGNVQKYMWRYENKGGVESLEKAQWYLNKLIEIQNDNS